jgi:hypothetical protein
MRPICDRSIVTRLGLALLLSAAVPAGAQEAGQRRVERVALPDGALLVVAEGDLEPRSIGSYAVRLYAAGDPAFPTDRFVAGVIRARDGTVERAELQDLDGDRRPELVVVMRAAGTGGYLSADAFGVGARRIAWRAGVAGLSADADPLPALRAKLNRGARR